MNSPRKAAKFTLIELLVVIAITAVLESLPPPALNKARESARTILCAGKMRQTGILLFGYAADKAGVFPCYSDTYYTMRTLSGYDCRTYTATSGVYPFQRSLKGVYLCPEQQAMAGSLYYLTSYGLTMLDGATEGNCGNGARRRFQGEEGRLPHASFEDPAPLFRAEPQAGRRREHRIQGEVKIC